MAKIILSHEEFGSLMEAAKNKTEFPPEIKEIEEEILARQIELTKKGKYTDKEIDQIVSLKTLKDELIAKWAQKMASDGK